MRFYVDIRVNLGLQFVIGILILVGLVGLSYPKPIPLKKKRKKKKKKKEPKPKTCFGRIGRILYDRTILYNLTRSYIQSYHFYNSATILNFLVRWNRKIMRFYNPDYDFDNHSSSLLPKIMHNH